MLFHLIWNTLKTKEKQLSSFSQFSHREDETVCNRPETLQSSGSQSVVPDQHPHSLGTY